MDYDMWMEMNIGVAKVIVDPEGTIYVKKCDECEKLLTAEEANYGHDCE